MTIPTLHLNGTAGEDLLNQILDSVNALRLAEEALQRAAPHPRDYPSPPRLPYAHTQAMIEHVERMNRVKILIQELNDLAIRIDTQNSNLQRRRGQA